MKVYSSNCFLFIVVSVRIAQGEKTPHIDSMKAALRLTCVFPCSCSPSLVDY